MKCILKSAKYLISFFAVPLLASAQLVVTGSGTTTADANALANTLLGPGFTLVGNAVYSGGDTGPGGVQQGGTFTGGASAGITINSGVLLTTGTVQNAVGPNNSGSTSYAWNTPGDAQLNTLASALPGSAGATTYDLNALTFTFNAPTAGKLFFNYVFASEEYNEWVGAYNDVFGFFLDGANVALLPGTSIPVSIDSVNLNNNSADYINNSTGAGTGVGPQPDPAAAVLKNIQYDGFTVPLTVNANISAGDHTISLQIADTGDSYYDSAVFIQGGSFSSNPTLPGVPDGGATAALLGGALVGLAALRRRFVS